MYKFVDTVEKAEIRDDMSFAVYFNGIKLDEALTDVNGSFKTISVSGRGVSNRLLRTFDVSGHGMGEIDSLMEVREIEIKYKMQDDTNEGFRDRFNELNRLLIGNKGVLEFTDEEAFFYATLSGGDLPEEDSNHLIGTISFSCTDPFKYSHEKEVTIDLGNSSIVVEGHESTSWRSETTFSESTDLYKLIIEGEDSTELRDSNTIVISYPFVKNDILEIDYKSRLIKLNDKNISSSLVIKSSNYKELPIGVVNVESTEITKIFYSNRYY